MFLYIFEDGTVKSYKDIGDGDLQSVENGYLTIIDISDPNAPKYTDGSLIETGMTCRNE